MNGRDTITYIIQTRDNEHYCGKTNDYKKRRLQHLNEKKPHWFAFKNRKQWNDFIIISGDYEKDIKRFGVGKFFKLIKEVSRP